MNDPFYLRRRARILLVIFLHTFLVYIFQDKCWSTIIPRVFAFIDLLNLFVFNEKNLGERRPFIICLESSNMNSVLAMFKPSLLAISQFLRFFKLEYTAYWTSVIGSPDAVRFVTSTFVI